MKKVALIWLLSFNCTIISSASDKNSLFSPDDIAGYESELRNQDAQSLYAYIKGKYQQVVHGRACIFFPAKSPKRLIITFGYALPDRYAMWTWFWQKDENWQDTAYLFLKDDDLCWYLGNDAKPAFDDYCTMICHFIALCGVRKDHVFTVGGSMGGYGAILFACALQLKGAIVDIPTVTRDIWHTHCPKNGTKIHAQNRWIDLDKALAQYQHIPLISIHHGKHMADVLAAQVLIECIKDKTELMIYRTTSKSHHSLFTITKASVEADIAYMERYDQTYKTFPANYVFDQTNSLCAHGDKLCAMGTGSESYQALKQGIAHNCHGVVLCNPLCHELFSATVNQLADLQSIPFIFVAYESSCPSTMAVSELLKLLSKKNGVCTVQRMPVGWHVSPLFLDGIVHYVGCQKSLQLPHFV